MSENNLRKTSTTEEWVEYAEAMDEISDAHENLSSMLSGSVPKNVYNDHLRRLEDAAVQLRSDLEDRMVEEHPEKWTMDVFYSDSASFECPKCGQETDTTTLDRLHMCVECSINMQDHG